MGELAVNNNEPPAREINVVPVQDAPGYWTVEVIDVPNEGAVYQTIFQGDSPEQRAKAYATSQYGWTAPPDNPETEDGR